MAPSKASTGRGNNKKAASHAKRPAAAAAAPADLSSSRPTLENPTAKAIQQSLLDLFSATFPAELNPNTTREVLQPLLQEVKHHLFHRDFASAFSRPELLRAYAARWSAARALAYLDVFRDVFPALEPLVDVERGLNVTCVGGGAGAEVAALARLQSFLLATNDEGRPLKLAVTAIDVADWASVVQHLQKTIAGDDGLARLDASNFRVTSHMADILDADASGQASITAGALASSQLVTLMFTLNELYSSSISRAQRFLLGLADRVASGALLLVVDSPGSFSTVGLGGSSDAARASQSQASKTERKYPMSWLMDHALLTTAAELERDAGHAGADGPWEKLETAESRWFRLPEGLRYPIVLENMRYQLHLFRRRDRGIRTTSSRPT